MFFSCLVRMQLQTYAHLHKEHPACSTPRGRAQEKKMMPTCVEMTTSKIQQVIARKGFPGGEIYQRTFAKAVAYQLPSNSGSSCHISNIFSNLLGYTVQVFFRVFPSFLPFPFSKFRPMSFCYGGINYDVI